MDFSLMSCSALVVLTLLSCAFHNNRDHNSPPTTTPTPPAPLFQQTSQPFEHLGAKRDFRLRSDGVMSRGPLNNGFERLRGNADEMREPNLASLAGVWILSQMSGCWTGAGPATVSTA